MFGTKRLGGPGDDGFITDSNPPLRTGDPVSR